MSENMQFVKVLRDARTPEGNFFGGEVRRVTDEVAGMLVGNAWAEKAEIDIPEVDETETPNVALEVDSVNLGNNVKEAG